MRSRHGQISRNFDSYLTMKKNRRSESGLFYSRILLALALCSVAALFGVLSFAQPAARTAISISSTGLTFSAPVELTKTPISPIFFQQDGEPEIHIDLFDNI